VTVPHKLAALAVCDQVSPAARAVGAVNCMHFDDGRLVGHNTDAPGFVDGLLAAGFSITSAARIVLLGAGGAARAVAHGLRDRGSIDVIARRPTSVTWTRALPWSDDQLRASFAQADLVVDCTPTGLSTENETALVDALPLDSLQRRAWVSTLIYHRSTILLERAKERGHSTVDGRAMLVHQGARAFAIWTKSPPPIDAMSRALDDALRGT
jgi:shikimate dehydrogenase